MSWNALSSTYLEEIIPCWVLFCNFFQLYPFWSTASPLLAIEMMIEIDGAAKATAETPFSFWKLPIQPMPLFLDGALQCKIPNHFSVYSLLYIHKNVYISDIPFQAANQERNQSYSDTWKQERGHTVIISECCSGATTFCISCTLTCWARRQFPPWSWVRASGANIQPHRLETSPFLKKN